MWGLEYERAGRKSGLSEDQQGRWSGVGWEAEKGSSSSPAGLEAGGGKRGGEGRDSPPG